MLNGNNLIIDIEGFNLTKEYIQFIEKVKPFGIILFKKNIKDYKQLSLLIKSIKDIHPDILIAIDEEGGLISPLEAIIPPLPQMPAYKYLTYEEAYYITKKHALEVKNLGFDIVFAPVLDINSNYKNPVIGARAFSDNSKEVIDFSIPYVKAYYDSNLLITGKHFPGHGLTNQDSHLILPVVQEEKSIIYAHIQPFKYFIDSNLLDFIMPAHVIYTSIDKENIATTSKKLITDILKKELNFKGLVVSDSISMKAFLNIDKLNLNIKKSFEAGIDIILSCGNLEFHKKVYNIIESLNLDYNHKLINEYRNLINKDNYITILDSILKKEFKTFKNNLINKIYIQDIKNNIHIKKIFEKYNFMVFEFDFSTTKELKPDSILILTQRPGLNSEQIDKLNNLINNTNFYIINTANPYICKQINNNCFSLYSKESLFIERFIKKIIRKELLNA